MTFRQLYFDYYCCCMHFWFRDRNIYKTTSIVAEMLHISYGPSIFTPLKLYLLFPSSSSQDTGLNDTIFCFIRRWTLKILLWYVHVLQNLLQNMARSRNFVKALRVLFFLLLLQVHSLINVVYIPTYIQYVDGEGKVKDLHIVLLVKRRKLIYLVLCQKKLYVSKPSKKILSIYLLLELLCC